MASLVLWLRRGADFVAASMLAVMFATFILQIVARYFFPFPVGWTVELCLTLWLWAVFWTCSFCLRDNDHVTFDILYTAAPPGAQRVMGIVAGLAMVAALGFALPPTWGFVDFLALKSSSTLNIPMNWVFMIFIVFMVVTLIRYAWATIGLIRHAPVDDREHHGLDIQ